MTMSEKTKIKVELPDDTKLTVTEKRLIVETWNARIKKDITYHGCVIFARLFMKFPDYLQYFEDLAQLYIKSKELMENKDFRAHCLTVMISLNTMIEYGLNDPPLLRALIAKVGRDHFKTKMPSVSIEHLFEIMLQYIIESLQKKTKPEIEEAWTKFISYIFEGILEELSV